MAIPPIIVVSGAPGAGKTSVSRRLAERLPRGVHIEADALQRMIVSGAVWPDAAARAEGEAARQLRLRGTHACLLARSFAEAGFVAVVDDVVVGERRDEFVAELGDMDWRLVLLVPSAEVLQRRNRVRAAAGGSNAWGQARALAKAVEATPGIHLDNGAGTVDETVEQILRALSGA